MGHSDLRRLDDETLLELLVELEQLRELAESVLLSRRRSEKRATSAQTRARVIMGFA